MTEGNASIDLTYSNLSNWNYKGQKIASVSYHLDISPNVSSTAARNAYTVNGQFLNTNFPSKAYFAFSNDPSRGFELFGVKAIAKITAYYADGTPVNFQNGTAYLSVGSLNNYMNTLASVWDSDNHYSTNGSSIESTQVINGGQAVGLSGSTVTAHANGWLYSDEPNSIADHSLIPGAHTSWSSSYHYDGHYGNWDNNGSSMQYVGAGLVRLQGPELTIQIGTIDKGIDPTATYRNWMWWNTSSVIPKTPDTIIHYHYDVSKRLWKIETLLINISDSVNTQTCFENTQKQNYDAYSKEMAKYNDQMAKLNQGSQASVITTDSVNQALQLKSENSANVVVESLNPDITVDHVGHLYRVYDKNNAYVNSINGAFLRVTYTNLKNSTYKNSKISKIVVTFSDSTPTGNRTTQSGLNAITNGASDNFLQVWADPVRGDMHSTTVTSTYQYYDANGNLIDFSGTNNAWLSVGSLNFDQGNNYRGDGNEGNPTSGISEGVKLISGGQIKQLAGSSISVHNDGWAYANFNNYSGTGMNNGRSTANGGSGWDMDGSPNAYYGAVVFQLNSSSISLRQGIVPWGGANIGSDRYNNRFLNNSWFIAGTTIPETKLQKPTLKTTPVHYHYDVFRIPIGEFKELRRCKDKQLIEINNI